MFIHECKDWIEISSVIYIYMFSAMQRLPLLNTMHVNVSWKFHRSRNIQMEIYGYLL